MANFSLFPEAPSMQVGEVARALDVSVDTIRRWEKKGLIRGHRDARGQRIFNLDEVRQLYSKLNDQTSRGFCVLKSEGSSPYTVIELFAGAGGLALGFEHAGLRAKTLVEIDSRAADTLKLNRPHWDVRAEDVEFLSSRQDEQGGAPGAAPAPQANAMPRKEEGFEEVDDGDLPF